MIRSEHERPDGPAGGHPGGRSVDSRGRRSPLTGRAAILVLVLGALVLTLALPVREWVAQRGEVASLRDRVAEAEAAVAGLEAERDRWRDPAFVMAQARRRLQLVLPGEVGYVVIDDDEAPASGGAGGAPPEPAGPWYSSLWESVQGADSGSEPRAESRR